MSTVVSCRWGGVGWGGERVGTRGRCWRRRRRRWRRQRVRCTVGAPQSRYSRRRRRHHELQVRAAPGADRRRPRRRPARYDRCSRLSFRSWRTRSAGRPVRDLRGVHGARRLQQLLLLRGRAHDRLHPQHLLQPRELHDQRVRGEPAVPGQRRLQPLPVQRLPQLLVVHAQHLPAVGGLLVSEGSLGGLAVPAPVLPLPPAAPVAPAAPAHRLPHLHPRLWHAQAAHQEAGLDAPPAGWHQHHAGRRGVHTRTRLGSQ